MSIIERMKNGLIVACQSPPDSPMANPEVMAAIARAAELGGADAIRADNPEVISAIRLAVNLPIIGSYKLKSPDSDVYITPNYEQARLIANAGADMIALDCTDRFRPNGEQIQEIIERIHTVLKIPVLADIANLDQGLKAEEMSVDAVATTLVSAVDHPDFQMITQLSRSLEIPVFCEGHIRTPQHAVEAFKAGAYAVVVGTAITSPEWLTRRFFSCLKANHCDKTR